MANLSSHFKRSEFACRCGCGFNAIDVTLIPILEDLRASFDAPVVINSGCRCEKHNNAERGAKNSQHLLGKAVDLRVTGIPPSTVATYLEAKYPDKYGIGRYPTFTHIDVRAIKARWS